MLGNRNGPQNEKPREKAATQSQGTTKRYNYSNSTTNGQLKDSRSRYDKGMSLYKEGKVKVGANGLFKVSGYYEADTERMTCTCPDYRTRKESCKHLFAAMLFVKNRGKQKIEDLDSNEDWLTEMMNDTRYDKPKGKDNGQRSNSEVTTSDKPTEANSKEFNRQATITRLAVINSAIELLKTHRKPIEAAEVISYAAQLEKWALGN